MDAKHLKLTKQQREVLLVLRKEPGLWCFQIGRRLHMGSRWSQNYLRPRLTALEKRGFLVSRNVGKNRVYSVGPMYDALMEAGLAK